jgi:hypothetical protein
MKKTILLLSLIILSQIGRAQIVRGAVEDEIYLCAYWHIEEPYNIYSSILLSQNNGENVQMQSYAPYIPTPPPGEIRMFAVAADATPGVVYTYSYSSLWRSENYGMDWAFVENALNYKYYCGIAPGEIYRLNMALCKSDDYGQEFEEVMDSVLLIRFEPGSEQGEFYGLALGDEVNNDFILVHTDNLGLSYDSIPLDTTITGANLGYYRPRLSHGTNAGEIYLISWHYPGIPMLDEYRIFFSHDYGQNFELRYVSEPFSTFYIGCNFTAGREQGSFYVSRMRLDTLTTIGSISIIAAIRPLPLKPISMIWKCLLGRKKTQARNLKLQPLPTPSQIAPKLTLPLSKGKTFPSIYTI